MATNRRRSSSRSRQSTSDAQALLDGALGMATSVADRQKENLAVTFHRAADATYQYGQSLEGLPYMREYIDEAANIFDDIGNYVQQADIRNLWEDAGSFARRRPAATLGIALLTGVLASQFIQSLSARQNYSSSRSQSRSRSRGSH